MVCPTCRPGGKTIHIDEISDESGATPLGDAPPFELDEGILSGEAVDIAVRGVSPAEQAECMYLWERDMDLCYSVGKAMGGYPGIQACVEKARYNYNICMGFTRPI
jgi:hypothetical protein